MGFGPDVLHQRNPGLIIVRITGFGQDGPYRDRPGFGTLVEAMSGFRLEERLRGSAAGAAAAGDGRHDLRTCTAPTRSWWRCAWWSAAAKAR